MTSILLFFFFLVLFVIVGAVFVGVYLLSKLMGGFSNLKHLFYQLTGWGCKDNARRTSAKKSASSRRSSRTSSTSQSTSSAQDSNSSSGKVFGQNEGTYVDFEEVKDNHH